MPSSIVIVSKGTLFIGFDMSIISLETFFTACLSSSSNQSSSV